MIVRAPRPQGGFTVLRNETLSDRRLSWAARGLLAFLLSKPDHWRVSVAHLITETAEARTRSGRDAVYSLMAELESAGYIVRAQARTADGRMGATEYHVHESPQTAAPLTAEPYTVAPLTADPPLVKTESVANTEESTFLPRARASSSSAEALAAMTGLAATHQHIVDAVAAGVTPDALRAMQARYPDKPAAYHIRAAIGAAKEPRHAAHRPARPTAAEACRLAREVGF